MFSQNIHSNWIVSSYPQRISDFLEDDVEVRKFGGLVGRFVAREYFCWIFCTFQLLTIETNILMHRFYKVTYIVNWNIY
jgi:hypothetical protein